MNIELIIEYANSNYKAKTVDKLPMDGINPRIRKYIEHTAGVLRAPTNFVFGEVVTILGAMLGRKVTVCDGAYYNRCNLFSAIVGVASGAKTPTINYCMKPINLMEKRNYDDFICKFKTAKAKEEELPEYDKQMIVSNETIENLYRVLYNVRNFPNGTLMHQDELLTFFGGNAKKYSDGNIISDFLTLFDALSTLRVGRVRLELPLVIDEPFLTILGGIQKKRIPELFLGQEHNGFFSRWQFWMPNADSPLIDDHDTSSDQEWEDLLDRATSSQLRKIQLNFEDVGFVRKLDDEYRRLRDKLEEEDEDELSETIMKQGYIIRRLAAIFHALNALAEGYEPKEVIRSETVEYASRVVEHLFRNSCIAQRIIEEQRKRPISMKDAIIALAGNCECNGIKINQSLLSLALGGKPKQQYISRILNEMKR